MPAECWPPPAPHGALTVSCCRGPLANCSPAPRNAHYIWLIYRNFVNHCGEARIVLRYACVRIFRNRNSFVGRAADSGALVIAFLTNDMDTPIRDYVRNLSHEKTERNTLAAKMQTIRHSIFKQLQSSRQAVGMATN